MFFIPSISSRFKIPVIFPLILIMAACSSTGSKATYSPPEKLRLAPVQRQEFVKSFLQGRWCEAENLFISSTNKYLSRDDICSAAYNYFLLWKLKAYVGMKEPKLLEKAKEVLSVDPTCRQLSETLPTGTDGRPEKLPVKDKPYAIALGKKDLEGLFSLLSKEKNQLYASVYGRKAAVLAIQEENLDWAKRFLVFTRRLDADLGWIVFALEDWRLFSQLAGDEKEKRLIARRMELLRKLVRPCD